MNDKLDRDEAERYLDLVAPDGSAGYLCCAFGFDPYRDEKGKYRHRRWQELPYYLPDHRAVLLDQVEAALLDGPPTDVYVCPALRIGPRRTGGTPLPLRLLWFDLDGPPADPALLDALGAVLVASGRPGHLHGYVVLDRPVDLATHRDLNERLSHRLGADAKWSDESLLRLPGTFNHKSGPAAPVVFA